jgi:hypothetical protein
MEGRKTEWTAIALLCLAVFFTHALSPNATSSDSYWTVPQILSILREGNLELSEFIAEGDRTGPHVRGLNCLSRSACYGHYPMAVSFYGVVPMAILDGALRLNPVRPPSTFPQVVRSFFERDYIAAHGPMEVVLASFLIALTAGLVFLTGREFLSRNQSLVLALIFAYATPAWSTGSRAMWQHTPEMLLLAAALYLLVTGRRWSTWSAIPLSLAYFVRPTASLVILVLAVYMFLHHRKRFWRWAALGVLTALPFVALNYSIYGKPLQPYFTEQRFLPAALSSIKPFLEAMAGNLASPSRGLLIFSPIFLFCLVAVRKNWRDPLMQSLLAILVLHWLAISAFADWTAGYCFGPRYFSDMTPILIFLLIPVLSRLRESTKTVQLLFALALAFSIAVHLRGAVHWDVHQWNHPGVTPARAWDWTDPQFARGLFPPRN